MNFLKDKLYLKSMVMFTFSKDELYLKSMVVIELFYLVRVTIFKKILVVEGPGHDHDPSKPLETSCTYCPKMCIKALIATKLISKSFRYCNMS